MLVLLNNNDGGRADTAGSGGGVGERQGGGTGQNQTKNTEGNQKTRRYCFVLKPLEAEGGSPVC